MSAITSKAGLAGQDDQVVEVVGVYAVQDLGRYKIVSIAADGSKHQSSQLVFLELTDGASVNLGARPDDERAALTGQKVSARGRYKDAWPPPDPKAAGPDPEPTLTEISAVTTAP